MYKNDCLTVTSLAQSICNIYSLLDGEQKKGALQVFDLSLAEGWSHSHICKWNKSPQVTVNLTIKMTLLSTSLYVGGKGIYYRAPESTHTHSSSDKIIPNVSEWLVRILMLKCLARSMVAASSPSTPDEVWSAKSSFSTSVSTICLTHTFNWCLIWQRLPHPPINHWLVELSTSSHTQLLVV